MMPFASPPTQRSLSTGSDRTSSSFLSSASSDQSSSSVMSSRSGDGGGGGVDTYSSPSPSPLSSAARPDGHVRVIARIRPMNQQEAKRGCRLAVYPQPLPQAETEFTSSTTTTDEENRDNNGNNSTTHSFSILSRLRSTFSSPTQQHEVYQDDDEDDYNNSSRNNNYSNNKSPEPLDEGILLADSTPLATNVNKALMRRDSLSPVPIISNPNNIPTQSTTTASAAAVSRVSKCLIAETSSNNSSTTAANTTNTNKRSFEFDAVVAASATQQDVYNCAVGTAVRTNVLQGYNTTILAYGQTASGKTFTMSGPSHAQRLSGETVLSPIVPTKNNNTDGDDDDDMVHEDDGIIARAIHELFQAKHELAAAGNKVTIRLSCLEIYQEELRDLLVDAKKNAGPANNNTINLKLRDQGDAQGVVVRGLLSIAVDSISQVRHLLDVATKRRTTGATRLNERSSRSHAICTLSVTTTSAKSSNRTGSGKRALPVMTAKLTLVDLAGSERIKETGVVGVQQQESININKDLFVLGKVVGALSERANANKLGGGSHSKKSVHVPYRDSKLTRLLRDSLGGNCCTVLIACVSPADINVDESINTLRYAERSRTITNTVKQNVLQGVNAGALTPAQCASLRAENKRLKAQVALLQKRIHSPSTTSAETNPFTPFAKTSECDDNNNTNFSVNQELLGLQQKLKQAEAEARTARENSRLVAQTAGEWRVHFENEKTRASKNDSVVSPCLSYELSMTPDDEDSLVDDNDDSFLSLDVEFTPSNSNLSEDDLMQLKVEVEALTNEKALMKESLLELSDQIECKRSELEKLDEEKSAFVIELEREQKLRDELALEVSNLRTRLHLLVTADARDDGATGRNGFRSLFPGFGTEKSASDDNPSTDEEVEMRIMRVAALSAKPTPSKNNKAMTTESESMKLAQELGRSLGEERTQREELQSKCTSLQKDVESMHNENAKLLHRNECLEKAIQALRAEVGMDGGESEYGDAIPLLDGTSASSEAVVTDIVNSPLASAAEQELLKSRAEQILLMVDMDLADTGSKSSVVSSLCTELFSVNDGRPEKEEGTETILISNIHEADKCTCEASMFGDNAEHVQFYLPQIGVSCVCGRKSNSLIATTVGGSSDLCSLDNILRPWQAEFLHSLGIASAIEFVHVFHQRSSVLAKDLRRWRKANKMPAVRTKSCRIALHIWNRTCKSVIKYAREQEARGVTTPEKPDFLQVTFSHERSDYSVSTLGIGSVFAEMTNKPYAME